MDHEAQTQPRSPFLWGFFVVGVISMIGGIFLFSWVVPRDMNNGGVPRDAMMIFTQVFSQQGLVRNELGRYGAALSQVGVDSETCQRYRCLLVVPPEGTDYEFRLSKGSNTWAIHSQSPVPKEILQ